MVLGVASVKRVRRCVRLHVTVWSCGCGALCRRENLLNEASLLSRVAFFARDSPMTFFAVDLRLSEITP